MRVVGLTVIAVALLIPFLWLPGIAQGRDVVALGSQYIGMAALIAMAIGQVIATRWPGVEAVFGPMDQSYRLHKWLGVGSMIALMLHDVIDAEMRGLGRETALVEIAETLGELSLYGLLILVVITIATFIPYNLWRWTHRFIGVFFVAGSAHYLFILKPFSNGDPLGLYMMAVCGLGTVAFAYSFAPRGLRRSFQYRIAAVTPQGDAVAVEMEPEGKPLAYRAGQFAFFAFTGANYSEPHPFTISSPPSEDGRLRVTVAPLGDLTSRLRHSVAVGQTVRVDGAYGRFGAPSKKPQVWVAAGVGITPFLALAGDLGAEGPPVHLIYAVRSQDKAAHLEELKEIAARSERFRLVVWESAQSGRLTVSNIASIAGSGFSESRVLFCGPTTMRRTLSAALPKHGVSARDFHYEEFEIRTGIGLRRFADWVWKKRTEARAT